MFSTWFNSWFGTGFGVGTGWWNNNWFQNPAQTKTTKQQKFPWLNQQQIANIEKYTANLTWAEKTQEQQKIYQAMIQAIEAENFNDSRTAMENERYRNSLSKTDPRECKFDQSACRQSALVDLVKDARNLKANTDENTVMQMFMQEMDYRGIGMDKLNAYLDNGDETILYETWLKTQGGGTKGVINQVWTSWKKTWGDKNLREKGETVTNYTNFVWWGTEELDEAANNFADRWLMLWQKAAQSTTEDLKNKIENMSPEEIERYRNIYKQLLADKDWRVGRVQGDTLVSQLWNGIKWDISYDYDDEGFMEWLVSQKANLFESLSGADDILKGEHNASVIQFFGNMPWSALKTFTATLRWLTNPYDNLKWLYKLVATKEWHQAILARYGSWDAFSDALNNDPVGVADDILALLELGTNIARWGMTAYGNYTWNPNIVAAANNIPVIWSANDALAQKTVGLGYWLMDNAAKYGDSQLSKLSNWSYDWDLLQKLSNQWQINSNASKLTQEWKDVYNAAKDYIWESSIGKGIKNFADELIDKTIGIDKEDRQFIRDNKDMVNDYVSKKKTVDTAFDKLKEMIDDKRLEKTEMWQEYWKLRKNKAKVVDTTWITNDMKKVLKDNGITIDKNWNLKFDDINKFNTKQKAALIDAWNEMKMVEWKKKINAWNVLDLRQKFDDKLNWDGKASDLNWNLTAADKATEWLIKEMRWVIDNRAKTNIEWLKELDAKYSEAWDEIQQIKKDWLNPDWTIKDSARSKLRNLTKAWNEAKLERLEKLMPWITQELKALDVALTVEKVTKMTPWQYIKWGAFGSTAVQQLLSGNILWALWIAAVWVLSTPKNFVWLITKYPEIWNKILQGIELTPTEMTQLQSIASRLQDGMDVENEE